MTEFDLRALLEVLHRREVRFVVIGGVAVAAHGYVRGTEDLDLVPDPDPANLDRLTKTLDELETTLPTVENRGFDPAIDAPVIRRGGNVTADTRFGGLDIVQRVGGLPSRYSWIFSPRSSIARNLARRRARVSGFLASSRR